MNKLKQYWEIYVQIPALIRLFWTHFSVIRGNFGHTAVWSEAILSALQCAQNRLWKYITENTSFHEMNKLKQYWEIYVQIPALIRLFWTHFSVIRGSFGHTAVWSEAILSALQCAQNRLWKYITENTSFHEMNKLKQYWEIYVQIPALIRLFWTHFSVIRGSFGHTAVWSEAILSALQCAQNRLWKYITENTSFHEMNKLKQYWEIYVQIPALIRLFWTHFSGIRGNFGHTAVWSEAILSALQSDQRRFRAHISLIRGWHSSA